jgi:hypothetical protein
MPISVEPGPVLARCSALDGLAGMERFGLSLRLQAREVIG